jgi:hypothetical protein
MTAPDQTAAPAVTWHPHSAGSLPFQMDGVGGGLYHLTFACPAAHAKLLAAAEAALGPAVREARAAAVAAARAGMAPKDDAATVIRREAERDLAAADKELIDLAGQQERARLGGDHERYASAGQRRYTLTETRKAAADRLSHAHALTVRAVADGKGRAHGAARDALAAAAAAARRERDELWADLARRLGPDLTRLAVLELVTVVAGMQQTLDPVVHAAAAEAAGE